MLNLSNYHNWKPSDKLWYNKYTCSIKIGPFHDTHCPDITGEHRSTNKYMWDATTHRIRILYKTVYTNDLLLVQDLADTHPYEYVKTPKDQNHELVLKSRNRRIEVRSILWHNQYRFKLDCWTTMYGGWRVDVVRQAMVQEVNDFIVENFLDTGRLRHEYWYGSIPTVYTNNEQALLLFKMRFSNEVKIHITEAITYDQITDSV